jgi:hypothetical protein
MQTPSMSLPDLPYHHLTSSKDAYLVVLTEHILDKKHLEKLRKYVLLASSGHLVARHYSRALKRLVTMFRLLGWIERRP